MGEYHEAVQYWGIFIPTLRGRGRGTSTKDSNNLNGRDQLPSCVQPTEIIPKEEVSRAQHEVIEYLDSVMM